MKKIRIIKSRPIKEEEEEVIDQVPQDTAPETLEITYETNPLEFILQKYPTLTETLVKLLTDDFRNYIIGVYIMAPKPTIFKIVLHNNRYFYLTYMGKCYEAKVSGKKFWLLKVSELETATIEIANLLMLGTPPSVKGPEAEMTAAPEEAPKEEAPAEETPPAEEEAPEELAESIKLRIVEASSLSPATLAKSSKAGGTRGDVLLKKIAKKEPIKLLSGEEIVIDIKKSKDFVDILKSQMYTRASNVKFFDTKGSAYTLGKLEKTADFGGKGTGAGVQIELGALAGLNKQLEELGPVDVKVGNKIYKNIVTGYKVDGTPKADLALKNDKGESVIFISHKDCCTAKNFQQYGGVSAFKDNKEVKAFADAVRQQIKKAKQTEMVRGGGFKRAVKDKQLILQSVYGLEVGGKFGFNNVQILMQGELKLTPIKGNVYELTSTHDIYNPTIPSGGYAPYFMATYRDGRNDLGIKNCRIGIYPVETRLSAQDI